MEFTAFPKIQRYFNQTVTVTEKIDGTNAAVVITEDGHIYAQSRKRVITPDDDNYGFAAWTDNNKAELSQLGPGVHFGEWWGRGIQRNYGLDRRVFSLFNTHRWSDPEVRPACCEVVPVVHQTLLELFDPTTLLAEFASGGSIAAPGFMNPEGLMAYVAPLGAYLKLPLDARPKGEA